MAGINDPLADAVPALRNNPVLPGPYAEYIGNRAMGVASAALGWEENSQFQLTYDVFLSTPGDLNAALTAILGTAARIGTPGATFVSMAYGIATGGTNVAGVATLITSRSIFSPWITNFWKDKTVIITGGLGVGATGNITSNTKDTLTINNLGGWPGGGVNNTSTFFIGVPYYINRTLPLRFPWPGFQHYVASRVANVQFYRFKGKQQPGGGLPNFADWNRARITVSFEPKPYPIISDTDLVNQHGRFDNSVASPSAALTNLLASPFLYAEGGYEANRYVEVRPIPSVYAITRLGQAFVLAEGAFAGTLISTGISQQLGQIALEYIWYNVPEPSLFPSDNILISAGYAQNQISIIGNLNIQQFGSFVQGTLLITDPRIEPMPAPFQVRDNVESTHRLWKVTVRAKYFNPQPAPLTQGWNTVPSVDDGQWYALRNKNTLQTLYNYQDLNYAFTSL